MKTDTYTKIVLTIIAFVLTANLFKGMITPAMADTKHYATVPLNADGSINVKISQQSTIDVRLRGIDRSLNMSWDPIPVKTDR